MSVAEELPTTLVEFQQTLERLYEEFADVADNDFEGMSASLSTLQEFVNDLNLFINRTQLDFEGTDSNGKVLQRSSVQHSDAPVSGRRATIIGAQSSAPSTRHSAKIRRV